MTQENNCKKLTLNKQLLFTMVQVEELTPKHLQLLLKAPLLVYFRLARLLTGNQVRNLQLGGRTKKGRKSCWFVINRCHLELFQGSWNTQMLQILSGDKVLSLKTDRHEGAGMKWGTWAIKRKRSYFFPHLSHFSQILTITILFQKVALNYSLPISSLAPRLLGWTHSLSKLIPQLNLRLLKK